MILHSPYLDVTPIYEYLLELERGNSDRGVAVRVPGLAELRWRYYGCARSQLLPSSWCCIVRAAGMIVISIPLVPFCQAGTR